MSRLAFKPDSSFFRKIVVGAIGARAVCEGLAEYGHRFVELERGSTNCKLWKDVKRKRVRIPDLVCTRCGQRIECRAKTKTELAMSHSPTDFERAWDFGMVDKDWIAFPVCEPVDTADWSSGKLAGASSYWHEKSWVDWRVKGHINHFTVEAFRARMHARSRTKGVEEASENFISWDATFSSRSGPVLAVDHEQRRVKIALPDGSRPYTWRIREGNDIFVSEGDTVVEKQVIAGSVPPISPDGLVCRAALSDEHIHRLIGSRERTQRFTGVKLARLLAASEYEAEAQQLAVDSEEDVYVRLEAVSYLVACCGHRAAASFEPYLQNSEPQTRLEAVIALGETKTDEAVDMLARILGDSAQPYFLRSAAAWSLSQIGTDRANAELIDAFSSVDVALRWEALDNLVAVGCPACDVLLHGLTHSDEAVVAGCAEALRQQQQWLTRDAIDSLIADVRSERPNKWVVWLIGNLPREHFNTAIAELQHSRPELHYAVSLLWSFVESWIARHWDSSPPTEFPHNRG